MESLPIKLNPHKLARQAKKMSGNIQLSTMTRLNNLYTQDDKGLASIQLKFDFDENNICFIQGRFNANIKVFCQRCTREMGLDLTNNFILSPVEEGQNMTNIKYDEVILDIDIINIQKMIEDEILLSIPYFPTHKNLNCSKLN